MNIDKIPFYQHDLGAPELASVAEVLKSPILTTGETVANFEKLFAELLGSRYTIGVTSCTGGLHISLLALGIGEGDEVITTPMTFIATATSILEAGAIPVFVDVEPETGNLDANKIEAAITPRTKAIMPVHLYGQMCDMRSIKRIAQTHNLYVIEDSAHCVEGRRDGVAPGELSDTACYSFYATKNLTCGEGGAITTNNEHLADKLRLLRSHGMNKTASDRAVEGYSHWDMVEMGWKYNMDNIQAALLLPQFERLEQNWNKRKILFERYTEILSGVSQITVPQIKAGVVHGYHLFVIQVDKGLRDQVISYLQSNGISVMVNYRPVHLMTYFRTSFGYNPGDFPIAEEFGDGAISLPFFPQMQITQVERVCATVKDFFAQFPDRKNVSNDFARVASTKK
ncbi:MAG: DegT/DnrJ/EryC1/StrS family aminotransferase [Leptolyngbya sp.]|nr:DegT/DnrJ/EryC1/StrS family aminotransferase [Candidatus Melainabacteria bacterium]